MRIEDCKNFPDASSRSEIIATYPPSEPNVDVCDLLWWPNALIKLQ